MTGLQVNRRRILAGLAGGLLAPSIAAGSGAAQASGPTVYISNETLVALDARTGEVQWRNGTGEFSHTKPIVADGTVFTTGERDGYAIRAVDAVTGENLWTNTDSEQYFTTAPAVAGETVYVGAGPYDDAFYAVDATSGDLEWRFTGASGKWQNDPHVSNGTVYAGNNDRTMYALDAESGQVRWQCREPGKGLFGSPTVADGTVYFGNQDESVYAVDAATGDVEWRFTQADTWVTAAPTIVDGVVYIGVPDDMYALDAESGDVKWSYGGSGDADATPTVVDGILYYTNDAGSLVALDAATGELRWEFDHTELRLPTVYDGAVYVNGNDSHLLVVVDAETGEQLWTFENDTPQGYHVPTVVDDPSGSSVDSLTRQGTLGNVGEGSGPPVAIEHLRLVQTVENSRAIEAGSDRRGLTDDAPVAASSTADDAHEDVSWVGPDPDFVSTKSTAPVFDLQVPDPGNHEELTVTTRLVGDDAVAQEQSMTLGGDVIGGDISFERRKSFEINGIDVPEPAPLLELLAEASVEDGDGVASGVSELLSSYPIFQMTSSLEFELKVDGPSLDEPATETIEIDRDDVTPMPRLSVGFIGAETGAATGDGTYTFDDESPGLIEYAESAARTLNQMFPTVGVDVVVETASIEGPPASSSSDIHTIAEQAHESLIDAIGDAESFRVSGEGDVNRDVDVSSVDATVAVVPQGDFFGQLSNMDSSFSGACPTTPGTNNPITDAVVVETDRERLTGHELVHLFVGALYDGDLAQDDWWITDDETHASEGIESVGYAIQDGDLEVKPGRKSLMAYTYSRWIDAKTYNELVDSRFDGLPTTGETIVGWGGDMKRGFQIVGESVRSVPEDVLSAADAVDLRERIASVESEFDSLVSDARGTWDTRQEIADDKLEEARSVAADAKEVGDSLADRGGEVLDGVGRTASDVGSDISDRAKGLEDTIDKHDGSVEYVVEVSGEIGENAVESGQLETAVTPVVSVPNELGGDASLSVKDTGGEVVEEASALTEIELLGDGHSTTVESVLHGAVRLPEEAATVEVTVEQGTGESGTGESDAGGGDAERVYAFHPATDPIRDRVEALPDRAFEETDVRDSVVANLEKVESLLQEGDRGGVATTLEGLYRTVEGAIPSDYEPAEPDEPTRDEMLATVGVQIQRFGGDVPDSSDATDDGLPTTWLLAGGCSAAAVSAGYLGYRRRKVGGVDTP